MVAAIIIGLGLLIVSGAALLAWADRVSAALIRSRAKRLQQPWAIRMEEEWLAELNGIPSRAGKLAFSISLRLARRHSFVSPTEAAVGAPLLGPVAAFWKTHGDSVRRHLVGMLLVVLLGIAGELISEVTGVSAWSLIIFIASLPLSLRSSSFGHWKDLRNGVALRIIFVPLMPGILTFLETASTPWGVFLMMLLMPDFCFNGLDYEPLTWRALFPPRLPLRILFAFLLTAAVTLLPGTLGLSGVDLFTIHLLLLTAGLVLLLFFMALREYRKWSSPSRLPD